jgi:hypothetical protein
MSSPEVYHRLFYAGARPGGQNSTKTLVRAGKWVMQQKTESRGCQRGNFLMSVGRPKQTLKSTSSSPFAEPTLEPLHPIVPAAVLRRVGDHLLSPRLACVQLRSRCLLLGVNQHSNISDATGHRHCRRYDQHARLWPRVVELQPEVAVSLRRPTVTVYKGRSCLALYTPRASSK